MGVIHFKGSVLFNLVFVRIDLEIFSSVLILPFFLLFSQEYEDKLTIVKVDHDLNPQLIQEYKVYGLPALILFKNGKEVPESRREGAISKAKLKEYIDGLLESVSVA